MSAKFNIPRALTLMIFCSTTVLFADDDEKTTLTTIESTTVDTAHQQITISGRGFGTAKPAVSLDDIPLNLITFTDTAITAFLPSHLNPGSYLLVIRKGWSVPAFFVATIGSS